MMTAPKTWVTVRQPEGFRSVTPLPSKRELAEFYAGTYYQQSATVSYQNAYSELELAYKRLYARLLLAAAEAPAMSCRLLDVGCGEGFLLAEAKAQGWDVTGTEFSGYAAEKFNPGIRDCICVGDVEEIVARFTAEGLTFDTCVLQNVVEHVLDPRQTLANMQGLMTPDGKLLMTLPNDYSAVQQLLVRDGAVPDEYWLCPPQHLHYFDIDAAAALARACGYRVVDMFSDFPIEMFLLHPDSNYVRNRSLGPAAHRARMAMSLLCAKKGIEPYLELSRANAKCGIGRAFTLVLAKD